jgi:hypothetical protein
MHLQIRSAPSISPPNLEKFLAVLKDAGVNLVAAGGGDLELPGHEFAFAPAHDKADGAMAALKKAGYKARLLNSDNGDFKLCWLTNEPGQLHACIAEVRAQNLISNKVIADILVGVEFDKTGKIPVQIYSVAAP